MTRTAHDWRDIETATDWGMPVEVCYRGTWLGIGTDRDDDGPALVLDNREEVEELIRVLQELAPRMLTREQQERIDAIERAGVRPPEPPREPEPPCMVTIIHKDGSREEVDADEAFGAGTYQAMAARAAREAGTRMHLLKGVTLLDLGMTRVEARDKLLLLADEIDAWPTDAPRESPIDAARKLITVSTEPDQGDNVKRWTATMRLRPIGCRVTEEPTIAEKLERVEEETDDAADKYREDNPRGEK